MNCLQCDRVMTMENESDEPGYCFGCAEINAPVEAVTYWLAPSTNVFQVEGFSETHLRLTRIGRMADGDFEKASESGGVMPNAWIEDLRRGSWEELHKDSDGNFWTADQIADMADSRC